MGDWQIFKSQSTLHYIYGAYYDNRDLVTDGPVVRILLFTPSQQHRENLYCQLWFEDSNDPTISNVTEKINLANDENLDSPPYMFSCNVPTSQRPVYVSLVSSPCEKCHNMVYIFQTERSFNIKKDFLGVVKDFNSEEDKSAMIIEWLEILKRFGVSKVYFYITKCHANVLKVLQFYEQMEFVTMKIMKYPEAIAEKNHKNALIPLHACLLENLNLYHFITPLDVNELIVPKKINDRTWKDLLTTSNDKRLDQGHYELFDAFSVQKVNFYVDIKSSKNFYFLENTQRSKTFASTGDNVRSFMALEQIKVINHQMPRLCLEKDDDCSLQYIDQSDGQLSHYVDSCEELVDEDKNECNQRVGKLVKDTALWKYKDNIVNGYNEAIRYIFKRV